MSEAGGQPSTHLDAWGWTPEEREAVLQDARTGQAPTKIGSPAAGKSWAQIRKLCNADESFALAYREARAAFLDALERVTESAAVHGFEEVTTTESPGREVTVTTYRKVDNRLRMSILAAQRPDEWGKRQTIEHTTGDQGIKIILPAAEQARRGPVDIHPKESEEGTS